jgi:hypothetical protein
MLVSQESDETRKPRYKKEHTVTLI